MLKYWFVLLFFPFAICAQVTEARTTVETLCAPSFHGRGYVEHGDSLAAVFIAQQFEKVGCKKFKSGVFQPFQFPVNTFPKRMTLKIEGQELIPGTDFIVDPGSGPGIASNIVLLELTTAQLFDPKKIKDRIAELAMQQGGRSKNNCALLISLVGLSGDTLKTAQKVAQELTNSFPIIEVVSAKFTWSVAQTQSRFPLFQVQQTAIPVDHSSLHVGFTVDAVLQNHTANNIIAYVPGKKRSKQYLVFTAHYDHLGQMGSQTYFPGGNDNASGTAMLIEMARFFAQHPLDIPVVFIAFAGEEVGLLGSEYYVNHPLFPLSRIQFLMNLDIMGSGEEGVTIVNATLFPEQFKLLTNINEKQHLLVKIGSRGPAANSDHYHFTEKGVPAFFMYTMGPNKHYHDVGDTYENLSFNEFNDLFRLLTEFGTEIGVKK
jgi:aminopeptidase YwaD